MPIARPATATQNQIRLAVATFRETGTKWRARRSVRYGCRRRTTADSVLNPRGNVGHTASAIAMTNSATTDAKTSTRSRWTARGCRR